MALRCKAVCYDSRPCFAKVAPSEYVNRCTCSILMSGFPNGKCKFCKPKRDETDGVSYPVDTHYLLRGGPTGYGS